MIYQILKKVRNFLRDKFVNPFHNYPFGREPLASEEEYLAIWEKTKKASFPNIDDYESKLGYRIDQEWLHELALHTQVVIKESEICYQHGRLLYASLCNYLKKQNYDSVNIVETGTARGFSSLCMAKALEDQKKEGKIVTVDPLPHNVKMYWNCIDDLEAEKTRKELLMGYSNLASRYVLFLEGKSTNFFDRDWIRLLKIILISPRALFSLFFKFSRIHFAFLDGAHDYDTVCQEYSYISSRQKKGDIIFFDDFQESYFPGIVRAVREFESQGNYSIKTLSVNDQRGYAIAEKIS